jgi:hypothetical protein
MLEANPMNDVSDKELIDAVGSKLSDVLSGHISPDIRELIVGSCQVGLLMDSKLLEMLKNSNFIKLDDPDSYPKYVEGKNNTWRMKISMCKKSNLKKQF